MTRRIVPAVLSVMLVAALAGCATPAQRSETAHTIAAGARMVPQVVDGGPYTLQAFVRLSAPGAPLRVYIEGDGDGFDDWGYATQDPTPKDPVTLRLAAADPASNVVYLGRPCQYQRSGRVGCRQEAWTIARLSPDVIESLDRAVETLRSGIGAPSVELVGLSGGGAAAVLIAARRTDVTQLRTVVANLDIDAWYAHHRRAYPSFQALSRSLNPAAVADAVAHIPQRHFVGGRDTVVPPLVAESYLRRMRDRRCTAVERVETANHDRPWPDLWPTLLQRPVACG